MAGVIDARKCLTCGSVRTHIKESRINPHNGYLVRYRACKHCGTTHKTYEVRADDFKRLSGFEYALLEIAQKAKDTVNKE